MKTLFLIYKPILDYEESEHSYCVCSTREKAQEIIDHTLTLFEEMYNRYIDSDVWGIEDEGTAINDPIASMFSFGEYRYHGRDCLEIKEIPYYT